MIVINYTENIWLKPFSNTIGVFFTNIIYNNMYNDLNDIFIGKSLTTEQQGGEKLQKPHSIHILKKILNEISSKDEKINILNKVKTIQQINNYGIIKTNIDINEENYLNIKKFLLMKDTISLYIWSFLLGTVTILISVNNTIRDICKSSSIDNDEFASYLKSKLSN